MNRSRLFITLATVVLIGATANLALAQNPAATPAPCAPTTELSVTTQKQSTADEQALPSAKANDALVSSSKKAIIETGISEPYFNEHFRLMKVVDEAGDRRVEWKYSINEYETTLVDDVGYFTSPAGERVDVHAIKNELFSAYDIKQTIPRSKAEGILKSCIGKHSDVLVVYRALKAPGKAGLYMTARSIPEIEREEEEGEREIEGLTFNVGFVDLESGKCTIQRGQVTP
jgi:hypothetical protein